jgi:putative zincin peptidase
MSLTLIDRFHPRLRKEQQEGINEGNLRKLEEAELLEPARLRPLVKLSLLMLVIGGAFFGILNIAAYARQPHATGGGLGGWGLLLWFAINIVGYVLILPIHELVHAAAFALWGGKPYFGTKLPYALYCGAKQQLFRRNQYLVVGLAPLLVITLAGIIFTLVSPALASYTIFATVGNVAGAAGDVFVAWRLLRLPESVLVEDTEAGYRVWEVTSPSSHEMLGGLRF